MTVLSHDLHEGNYSKVYTNEALTSFRNERKLSKILVVVACCLLVLGIGILIAGIYFMSGKPLVTTAFVLGAVLVANAAILAFSAVFFLKKKVD